MELEESLYWLELLEGAGIKNGLPLDQLKKETGELCAIFVSLIKRAKRTCLLPSAFCLLPSALV